jgi:F-type H+-transporting ATPase subunit alpha
MKAQHGALVDKIETSKDLDKDGEAQLATAVAEFKKNWA